MRIKRQWGEWDDPSLQVLHCTTTTSSPKLTQIGKEAFSVSLGQFFQPPTSTFYTQNVPSSTPRKENLSSHLNWPKLSKSLSFPAKNKYLQLWFSTSILIEHRSLPGSKSCKSFLKSKSWKTTKLLLPKLWWWIMLNRTNTRSVNQWEFEQDRQDFPFQVSSDWQISQF